MAKRNRAISDSHSDRPGNIVAIPKNLRNEAAARRFIEKINRFTSDEVAKLAQAIAAQEEHQDGVEMNETLVNFEGRAGNEGGPARLRRYADVVEDILTKKTPDGATASDPRAWGGLPHSGLNKDRQVFFVIGGPGTGKSRISKPLAEATHSVVIDSDDVKAKLPEYGGGKGAHRLQEESSYIVEMPNGLLACAAAQRMNLVYPKVGKSKDKLIEEMRRFSAIGYNAHLVLVRCDLRESLFRVLRRFLDKGRYVSPKYVVEVVGTRPEHVYQDVRKVEWESWSAYDTSDASKSPEQYDTSPFAPTF